MRLTLTLIKDSVPFRQCESLFQHFRISPIKKGIQKDICLNIAVVEHGTIASEADKCVQCLKYEKVEHNDSGNRKNNAREKKKKQISIPRDVTEHKSYAL